LSHCSPRHSGTERGSWEELDSPPPPSPFLAIDPSASPGCRSPDLHHPPILPHSSQSGQRYLKLIIFLHENIRTTRRHSRTQS
jgi:hypothetical protein